MNKLTSKRKWLLIFVPLLVMAFIFSACEPAEEGEGLDEPGVEDGVVGEEGDGLLTTPEGEVGGDGDVVGTEEPLATPVVTSTQEEEATEEATEMATEEATEMATEEATEIATEEATEEAGALGTPTVGAGAQTGDFANVIPSDQLIGMNVVTQDGEEVAQIEEVLIDQDGTIQYVIFDTGTFLDTDSRTVAVQWTMFESDMSLMGMGQTGDAGTGDTTTGTPEATEGTPAAGDTGQAMQGQERTLTFTGTAQDLETATELDMANLEDADLVLNADELGLSAEFDQLIQVSEFSDFSLTGFNLMNEQDEDLGEIDELVLDLENGEVAYAVADVGGFLGLGEKQVAIPWERLTLNQENQEFVLNVDQQTLEDAPSVDLSVFDQDQVVEQTWDDDIETFWEGIS